MRELSFCLCLVIISYTSFKFGIELFILWAKKKDFSVLIISSLLLMAILILLLFYI